MKSGYWLVDGGQVDLHMYVACTFAGVQDGQFDVIN